MIACLARFHRKSVPAKDDALLAALPEPSGRQLRMLIAVARIAVALDRRNTASAVASVSVLPDKDSIVLVVTPARGSGPEDVADVGLEMWAARQELPFFEKVLKRTCCIVEGNAQQQQGDGAACSVLSS